MQLNKLTILLILLIFTSCLKSRLNKQQEEIQIINFISQTKLDFYKAKKGYYYHIQYKGAPPKLMDGDSITLEYSGFNIDKNEYFIKNDTVKFILGDNKINPYLTQILQTLYDGAVGIIILPNYLAYGSHSLPNIDANATIAIFFRIISKKTLTNAISEFNEFIQTNFKKFDITADSSIYIQHDFYGIGINAQNLNNITIEYKAYLLNDTTPYQIRDTFLFTNENSPVPGLKIAIPYLNDGDMAEIYIPPNLGYLQNPPYNIPPFSPLHFTVRLLSKDPDIAEDSNIRKFLFIHKPTTVDTLPNGIIYIPETVNSQNATPSLNDTLIIEFSASIINKPTAYLYCSECKRVLNSQNFFPALTDAIKQTMHIEDKAYFIIPYSLAYGANGTQNIPPYSTILYYIHIKNIIRP